MRVIFLFLLFFSIIINTYSQDMQVKDYVNYPSAIQDTLIDDALICKYKKAKIVTNDYEKIFSKNVKLYSSYVLFDNENNHKKDSIPLNQIILINAATGSYHFEGALIGGIAGLVLPIAYTPKDSDPEPEFYLYTTIIGTVVGFLIGLNFDNYDVVYHEGDFFISLNDTEIRQTANTFKSTNLINFKLIINN